MAYIAQVVALIYVIGGLQSVLYLKKKLVHMSIIVRGIRMQTQGHKLRGKYSPTVLWQSWTLELHGTVKSVLVPYIESHLINSDCIHCILGIGHAVIL